MKFADDSPRLFLTQEMKAPFGDISTIRTDFPGDVFAYREYFSVQILDQDGTLLVSTKT